MPKGLFAQCVCVLTDGSMTIADVRAAINAAGFSIVRELAAGERWEFGGPSLVISYRPEINGTVVADVIERPWPDAMGDPKTDPFIFGAWGMGQFGPFTYPCGLQRASEHSWSWPEGRNVALRHQGVVRLRLTYAGGLPETPCIPASSDPLSEMIFLTRLALAIGSVSSASCYFNPSGEVLRDFAKVESVLQACVEQQKQPIHLWANARLFRLSPEFGFMDTVGNEQLNVGDVEVVYPVEGYQPADIDYYMRNVTHYLLGVGRDLQTGETIDGPGERGLSWIIEVPDEPLVSPPRRVLRLFPTAKAKAIREVLGQIS